MTLCFIIFISGHWYFGRAYDINYCLSEYTESHEGKNHTPGKEPGKLLRYDTRGVSAGMEIYAVKGFIVGLEN